MGRSLVEQAFHDPEKLKELMGIVQGKSSGASPEESLSSRLRDLEGSVLDRAELQRVLPEVLKLYVISLDIQKRIYSLLSSVYEKDADKDGEKTG